VPVQLVLDTPTSLVHGLRFVLRDPAAQLTLGGGVVIDPLAPRRGRAAPARLAALEIMRRVEPQQVFTDLLSTAASGVAIAPFSTARNLTAKEADELLTGVPHDQLVTAAGDVALAPGQLAAWDAGICSALGDWHAGHPHEVGPEPERLWKSVAVAPPRELRSALLERLIRSREVVRDGSGLRLPGHAPEWPEAERARWEALSGRFTPRALQPLTVGDLAKELEADTAELGAFLQRVARRGALVQVTANRFLHPAAVAWLAHHAERLAGEAPDGLFDAAAFRDGAGIGRNFTIALLEHFDTIGLTLRLGNRRRLRQSATALFGDEEEHASVSGVG